MPARGPNARPPRFELVVIIASLGGLAPLSALLAGLPASFPVPLLVLRHHPTGDGLDRLPWLLAKQSVLPVRPAGQGVFPHRPGVTVIAPGHSAAVHAGGYLRVLPHVQPHAQPRAGRAGQGGDGDALLASAAAAATGGGVIGVVLSGMMHDGTEGVRAVKRNGGRVLAQDPETAKAPGMPASAIATGCVDFILPPGRMPAALISLAMAPGGAQLLTVPIPHWAKLGA